MCQSRPKVFQQALSTFAAQVQLHYVVIQILKVVYVWLKRVHDNERYFFFGQILEFNSYCGIQTLLSVNGWAAHFKSRLANVWIVQRRVKSLFLKRFSLFLFLFLVKQLMGVMWRRETSSKHSYTWYGRIFAGSYCYTFRFFLTSRFFL